MSQTKKVKKSDIKVENEEEIFGLSNEEVLGLQKSFELRNISSYVLQTYYN